MAQFMEEMRDEAIQRGVEMVRLESIKNIMKNFKVTAEKAMEALEIPQADRAKYLAKI